MPLPGRRGFPFALTALVVVLAPTAAATHVQDGISWACGFNGSGREGHPSRCGIDPIGGQGVHSAGEPEWGPSWIGGDDRVLGVAINGDARAIPVKMLDHHEIVNDVIGDVPVAVTYCPLCDSALTFERVVTIDGQAHGLDFEASGFLYKHNLVMWDPDTGTLWTQIRGEPIGTLDGTRVEADHLDARLVTVPTQVTTWDQWREEHPASLMLQGIPGIRYGGAYGGYDSSCQFGISNQFECDVDGLHPKEEIIGVDGPRGAVAFPYFAVLAQGQVAYDPARGIVVVTGAETKAFDAGPHTFQRLGDEWVDESGRAWDLANGRRNGESLAPWPFVAMFWFAWQDHHPDTGLWLPADVGGAMKLEDKGTPGAPPSILVALLVLATWIWKKR